MAKKPAAKAPAKKGPGIGGGKRGQRLAAGATAYTSPNISGEQPAGVTPGAYNSGTTMDQIKRNEYLNTLSTEDKARYMNQTGYWTGGVPTATPKVSTKTLEAYGKGNTYAGTYEYAPGGVFAGSVTVDANGKVTGTSAYRKSDSLNKGKGKGKGKGKPKNGSGATGPAGTAGGDSVTAESIASTSKPYAEADVSTTSYRRAQGKAYGKGEGSYLAGGDSTPTDSAVVPGAESGGGGKRANQKKKGKKLTAAAKKKSSPGGKKVTPAERKRIQAAKPPRQGKQK